MNDLISVIIPTYNEEERIKRAIDSIRNQTYSNLEIIVVDDQSTDNTKKIVENIIKEDNRVQYHLIPKAPKRTNWRGYDINAGFAARNYGFKIAKGEWITTQDADDASMKNRVETQYLLAKKHNATLVTISWQKLNENLIDQELDFEKILTQNHNLTFNPESIYQMAKNNKGLLMIEPIHQFIPFPIKWFPYFRGLFYRSNSPYPGADNSMLFNKTVRDKGFYFRTRNQRTWGTPSGRGSGRDFAFRVAFNFKNSWSFKIPLYLWDVKTQNPELTNIDLCIK